MTNYFRKLISSNDTASSKRFVTLVIAAHFIVASFVILFFTFYVILYMPKGKIEPQLLETLKQVLEYDFYIILSGLGFITVEGFTKLMIKRFTKLKDPDDDNDNKDPKPEDSKIGE